MMRQKRCRDEKGGSERGKIRTKVKTRFRVSSVGLIRKLFSSMEPKKKPDSESEVGTAEVIILYEGADKTTREVLKPLNYSFLERIASCAAVCSTHAQIRRSTLHLHTSCRAKSTTWREEKVTGR